MQTLKIYNAQNQVLELPRTKKISMGGELVATEVTMVSGRKVQYVQGFRPSFTAEWEWFPNDLLARLTNLLRQGGYFKVEYPDQDGVDKSGYFAISYPSTGIFKFKDGKPMWYGVSLTFSAQEVL